MHPHTGMTRCSHCMRWLEMWEATAPRRWRQLQRRFCNADHLHAFFAARGVDPDTVPVYRDFDLEDEGALVSL